MTDLLDNLVMGVYHGGYGYGYGYGYLSYLVFMLPALILGLLEAESCTEEDRRSTPSLGS